MVQTTHTKLTTVGERKITVNGQTISYIIKRSSRAKHVRLEVRQETGLTVVIPSSYKIKQLPILLESKGNWISDKLTKYGQVQSLSDKTEVKSGDTIPYLGRNLEVVKRQNRRNANSIRLERNRLVVAIGSVSSRLNLVLEQWYRMQAAKLIKERADKLSARLGLTYNRILIRGQKTRWGSCSHKGNLSFNWKLIMAPEPVIDYVIIHELAHLKEMNHTKRFWGLVAEHCPRWREHKKWLKDHQTELADKLSY
jgi:hypothetical protein